LRVAPDFDGRRLPGAQYPAAQYPAAASAFLTAGTSSFSDFLDLAAPGLQLAGAARAMGAAVPADAVRDLPHATTIVAAVYADGVVMAGDRRATAGNMIAQRDIEKVFRTDDFSAIGIAGAAGIAIDMARLYQVELEHYEKIEGRTLSLEGKANRLAGMVRGNLPAAMQGLVVVPLFAGFDEEREIGRIFDYDVAGGRYEEQRFHAIGSGSVFARGSLKKLYRAGMSLEDTVTVVLQALYDAADDDSATGGPDVSRGIYPVVASITADGFTRLTDEQTATYARAIVDERMRQPDGPVAPLRD
jgi:proteasome beta subunit